MTFDKQVLRQEALRHRTLIDPRADHPEDAVQHFVSAVQPVKGQIIAFYCAKEREFDPSPIMEHVQADGFTCCLPVVQPESRVLKFVPWQEGDDLAEGPYNILQPVVTDDTAFAVPDIVVVPLLAFDRRGHRLGYGGGYYDATLRDLRDKKDVVAVGVGYSQQACLFNLPVEDHDQKLNWVVTPKGAQFFE